MYNIVATMLGFKPDLAGRVQHGLGKAHHAQCRHAWVVLIIDAAEALRISG